MELSTIIVLSLGVFLGGFIQTALGFAAGLVAFPIILLKLDFHQASAVMSIYFLAFSLIFTPQVWKDVNKKLALKLGLWGGIGTVIGVITLKYANLELLRHFLGAFIIFYVLYEKLKKSDHKLPYINKLAPLFGFTGGFSSGLFSHGGAFFVVYLNNQLSSIRKLRATIIAVIAIGNILRIPTLIQTGIFTTETLPIGLYALPAFTLSLILGHFFHKKSSTTILKNLTLIFLAFAGLYLLLN